MRAVLTPACQEELFAAWQTHPDAIPMAGGSDLLVKLRSADSSDLRPLLLLSRIGELNGIIQDDSHICIGAAVTFSHIIAHHAILSHAPILADAATQMGGPAIRNMATIGGNICTASPAGDALPPLYILEAEVELLSASGARRLPLADFIHGPGKTALRQGELLTRVIIPQGKTFAVSRFEKVGRRKSLAISVASLAAMFSLSEDGAITEARLAWGSVGPTVVRLNSLEKDLQGQKTCQLNMRRIVETVRDGVAPIDDIRATATYRRSVSANLLMRLLESLNA